VEFEIKTLRTALAVNLGLTNAQTTRLQQLQELDEKGLDAIHQTTIFSSKEPGGMTKLLDISSSKKVIGLYYMIPGLKISKENYEQGG